MNRDLDEIEAEMGKERTLKVGDRVRTIDGKVGRILSITRSTDEARHRLLFDVYDVENTGGSYFGWQLTPVEEKCICDHAKGCLRFDCQHLYAHMCMNRCGDSSTCISGGSERMVHCIPVEPERVKPEWCDWDGLCSWDHDRETCLVMCAHYRHPVYPGLLQRMGMTVGPSEDRDWFVVVDSDVSGWFGYGSGMTLKRHTKEEALQECKDEPRARMFRWQDGAQG